MSPRLRSNLAVLQELASVSLLLGLMPALTLGVAKWIIFAAHLEVGRQTAFYYFRTAVTDYRLLLIVLIVLSIIVVIHFMLAASLRDPIKARAYVHYAVMATLFGLLLLTAYWLNKSAWYPDSSSVAGLGANGAVAAVFALVGLAIHRGPPGLNAFLGFIVAALVLVPTNAYFSYRQAMTPVVFTDVADEIGITEINNSLGVAWGDYDDDGWPDLYISNHLPASTKSLLYRNEGGRFSFPRVMANGDLHGAAWGDFDGDGALDLFVAGGNDTPYGPAYPNLLFHNERGDLTDVAATAGVDEAAGRAWGGTWADFNNDGLLDLLVVNYFTSNDLFLNEGGGTFRNVAKFAGIAEADPGAENEVGTLCASWGDYDGDGDVDLVSVAIHSGIALFRNNGDGTFVDVAQEASVVTNGSLGTEADPRGPTACAWGDYDNDSDLDLFVGVLTDGSSRNLLFQNQGNGTFVEVAAPARLARAAATRAAMWADFDNDGDLDLYVVNEAFDDAEKAVRGDAYGWNSLYMNEGDGTFSEVGADAAGTAGFPTVHEGTAAIADFDNDGFIDILVCNQRSADGYPLYLRRNLLLRNSGNGNNWLELRLRGTVSNPGGVGAKVYLTAGNKEQFRERAGESHTFAQNSTIIHFGLADAAKADRVVVKWPSGTTQILTDVAANLVLTVTEPAGR
jgi:hypothetical protein